jgi:hypothetical protein
MSLYIAEFAGVASGDGSSHPKHLLASQTLAVGAGNVQSAATNARTTLVRLLADEDCDVAIGADPDATADAVIALVADRETHVHVTSGEKLAVVVRA